MRCPDCNKFRSTEPGEPEINYEDLLGDVIVVRVEVPLECTDCGGLLATKRFTAEIAIPKDAEIEEEV